MEDWEKKIIVKNMDKLVKTTICNVRLLAALQASEILGDDDIDFLLGLKGNRGDQVFQLYTILQKRVNAFEALLEGLQQTNQSGAIEILTTSPEQNSSSFALNISYDVNTVLGNGSYGTVVYKGKFGDLDVAVKKVHLSMFGGAQALHEVKVLKDCEAHENVVMYFGAKQNKEFVLIALELCEMSLTQWVENSTKNETAPLENGTDLTCTEVLRQITVGLDWLHSNKIVHRDIKPENVLLLLKLKRAKLSDFGLSRHMLDGNSFVATSIAGGTPGWMAPEILAYVVEKKSTECKFTYASDVFSLGCIYYFVLTDGKYAFGDSVRCQANILDGKSLIVANEIKHCISQSIMFNLIKLMISMDQKSRPACSTLLCSPVWSQNNSTLRYKTTFSSLPHQKITPPHGYSTHNGAVEEKVPLENDVPISPLRRLSAVFFNFVQGYRADLPESAACETEQLAVSVLSSDINTDSDVSNPTHQDDDTHLSCMQEKITKYLNDLKQMDSKSTTEKLMELILSEDLYIIQNVLEKGGAGSEMKITEICDLKQRTMLHYAVDRGDYDIVEYLINVHGFDTVLCKPITMSLSNVMFCCIHNVYRIEAEVYKNKCKILELLFSKQPQLIESRGGYYDRGNDCTPLLYATPGRFINGKQTEFIDFLLKYNADVNARTREGNTPLHCAVQAPVSTTVLSIVHLLISHGANTDAVNKKGYKFWHKEANDAPPDLYQDILDYLVSIQKITEEDESNILGRNF